jgi:hypothetical protein
MSSTVPYKFKVDTFQSNGCVKESIYNAFDKEAAQRQWDRWVLYSGTSRVRIYGLRSTGRYELIDVWIWNMNSGEDKERRAVSINWGNWTDFVPKKLEQRVSKNPLSSFTNFENESMEESP